MRRARPRALPSAASSRRRKASRSSAAGGRGPATCSPRSRSPRRRRARPCSRRRLVLPATLAAAGARRRARRRGERRPGGSPANTAGALAGALAAPCRSCRRSASGRVRGARRALRRRGGVARARGARRLRVAFRDVALGVGRVLVISRGSPVGAAAAAPRARRPPGRGRAERGGLVAVVERDGDRLLQVDNHYALGGSADAVHQERQGHLPLLLHPAPRRVALDRLRDRHQRRRGARARERRARSTLVELVPGVARAARALVRRRNRGVYDDPRARSCSTTARNFLRATRARFDVIVARPLRAVAGGRGALYTREHFEAVRARLAPGGLFCQWLPLYQLSEAGVRRDRRDLPRRVPRRGLLRGDFSRPSRSSRWSASRGRRPTRATGRRAAPAAARGGRPRPLGDAPDRARSRSTSGRSPRSRTLRAPLPRNRDDRPVIEFLAARAHAGGAGKPAPFTGLAFVAFAKDLRQSAAAALAALPATRAARATAGTRSRSPARSTPPAAAPRPARRSPPQPTSSRPTSSPTPRPTRPWPRPGTPGPSSGTFVKKSNCSPNNLTS